jgi:drug/metabolite transporter (DMT)-like permease
MKQDSTGVSSIRAGISPIIILLVGILAVSTGSIFIRFAQVEAPSIVIACYRLGMATLILAPFVISQKREEISRLQRRQFCMLILSGFFLALHFASWITSLEHTSIVSSVVLVTTTPLWVALFSLFILNEQLSWKLGLGLAFALIGGLAVAGGQGCQVIGIQLKCSSSLDLTQGKVFWGNILALIGAVCAGGYVLAGRSLRRSVSILTYTFLVYGAAFFFLFIAAIFTRQQLIGYSGATTIWLLALAVIPQLLGHSSFNWALGYLSATYVAISLLGEPLGATALAYIFLHEIPTILEVSGGVLIITGIFIASQSEGS